MKDQCEQGVQHEDQATSTDIRTSESHSKIIDRFRADLRLFNLNEEDFDIDNLIEIMGKVNKDTLRAKVRNCILQLVNKNVVVSVATDKIMPEPNTNNFTRCPIQCPLSNCDVLIGTTAVLTHFLLEHRKKFHTAHYQKIQHIESAKLEFSDQLIHFGSVISLGILLYAGFGKNNRNYPVQLGICRPNSYLPERYHEFVNHLPIIVLAAKVCNTALFSDPNIRSEFYNSEDTAAQLIILWLLTVETTKPMYGTITVYDTAGTLSRSTVVKLKSIQEEHDPNEFISNDINYLMLRQGEIDLLTNYGNSNICLDIFCQEC